MSRSVCALRSLGDHYLLRGVPLRWFRAPSVIDGSINGEVFTLYVKKVLAPHGEERGCHPRQSRQPQGQVRLFLPPTARTSIRSNERHRPTPSAALVVKCGSSLPHRDLRAANSLVRLRGNGKTYSTPTGQQRAALVSEPLRWRLIRRQ